MRVSWGHCYDFKIFSPNMEEIYGIVAQILAMPKIIITLFFKKNHQKYQNIDPWQAVWSILGQSLPPSEVGAIQQ
jgi:hypothetical protein